MRAAMTSPQALPGPLLALGPVGLFVAIAAMLIVAPTPPPASWLVAICFGAFASLILLWRSGAPVIAQSGISMLIITELLMLGLRADGLGMRNVETKVSSAIDAPDSDPVRIDSPAGGAARVSISATSSDSSREADELSRRIQLELPDHPLEGEIQGDLKVDRRGKDTRLALSWSVGPAGAAAWCGSTSVFASDASTGIALLASQVVRKASTPRGTRGGCGT